MENMKCPHRTRTVTQYSYWQTLDDDKAIPLREVTIQEFEDCLKEQCMAYREHRRTQICQKFPMGYYKDILD